MLAFFERCSRASLLSVSTTLSWSTPHSRPHPKNFSRPYWSNASTREGGDPEWVSVAPSYRCADRRRDTLTTFHKRPWQVLNPRLLSSPATSTRVQPRSFSSRAVVRACAGPFARVPDCPRRVVL